MDVKKITNNEKLDFKLIEDEKYRVYDFGQGKTTRIDNPVAMNFNLKSGGHRVLDKQGIAHYIPAGWIHLYWEPREGMLPFTF